MIPHIYIYIYKSSQYTTMTYMIFTHIKRQCKTQHIQAFLIVSKHFILFDHWRSYTGNEIPARDEMYWNSTEFSPDNKNYRAPDAILSYSWFIFLKCSFCVNHAKQGKCVVGIWWYGIYRCWCEILHLIRGSKGFVLQNYMTCLQYSSLFPEIIRDNHRLSHR